MLSQVLEIEDESDLTRGKVYVYNSVKTHQEVWEQQEVEIQEPRNSKPVNNLLNLYSTQQSRKRSFQMRNELQLLTKRSASTTPHAPPHLRQRRSKNNKKQRKHRIDTCCTRHFVKLKVDNTKSHKRHSTVPRDSSPPTQNPGSRLHAGKP